MTNDSLPGPEARHGAGLGARPFATDAEAALLCDAFLAGTLPKPAWTHRAHLAAALWHLDRHPADRALDLMRDAIKRSNRSVGTIDSPTEGYHETITIVYLRITARFRAGWTGPSNFADRANALYEDWGDRNLPLRHYSRERLYSCRGPRGMDRAGPRSDPDTVIRGSAPTEGSCPQAPRAAE